MTLTSRVTISDNTIMAWIDLDNVPWIEQPFEPETHEAWTSESEAQSWADNWIEEFNNRPEPTPLA